MSNAPTSAKRRAFMFKVAPAVGMTTLGVPAVGTSRAREAYCPTFFTESEWDFLRAVVARLIPSDPAGTGGVEAGVPEFIDRQLEMPYGYGAYFYMRGPFKTDVEPTLGYQLSYSPRELYRLGIPQTEKACEKQYGKRFAALPAAQQDELLHLLEAGRVDLGALPSAAFFAQVLSNVKEGYFADPMYGGNRNMVSWKLIGFPGARADFTDWMDQQGRAYPFGPVSINGNK